MKTFKITTQIQSTQTVEYIVEAATEEEAIEMISGGEERGEGEIVEDYIDWGSEEIIDTEFIEEIDQAFKTI